MTDLSITPNTVEPDQTDKVATQCDFQNYFSPTFYRFPGLFLMTDNSHSNPWQFKTLAQIIIFDELTLDICVGILSCFY